MLRNRERPALADSLKQLAQFRLRFESPNRSLTGVHANRPIVKTVCQSPRSRPEKLYDRETEIFTLYVNGVICFFDR